MKRITSLLLGLLCSMQSVVYSQMDTIYNRHPSYYYTSWYDGCYAEGEGAYMNGSFFSSSEKIDAFYQYTNEPMEIIGIAVGVRRTVFQDTTRVPEYVLLVDGVDDSTQYVIIDSARWDTATPKIMMLEQRKFELVGYTYDTIYDEYGNAWLDPTAVYDTIDYYFPLSICEAYFKAPITVNDSFFLGITYLNNIYIPYGSDIQPYPEGLNFVHQATMYELGVVTSTSCRHFAPEIRSFDGGITWRRSFPTLPDGDPANNHYTYNTVFPIIRVKDTFSVQVMSNDDMQGTVQGGGAYLENSSVTITAVPAECYKFIMWNDSVTTNPRTFTLKQDTVFTAYFAEAAQYTVEVASADLSQGSVQGGGTYYETSTATITAVPNEGYKFAMWNDSVTANPRTLVVTQDTAFTAFFEVKVGIAEAEAAGELFSISPNPTTKNLQITIRQEGAYTMEIYSANGVMLKQESIANMSTIDVSELLAGSYVIKIYNDNFSGVRTFVKK